MGSLRRGFDTYFRRRFSLTAIIIIFCICMIAALSTGYWLPARLAWVILLGIPVAYFWAKANSRNLEVKVERPLDRLQEGQVFEERITVKNLSWFPKLWLEVSDPYVERLLEGSAFLNARVQLRLDSEFPRFTERLLEIVYPQYLAPIPSMTVCRDAPDGA